MEKIKILFVGAGVSNLVAANRLLDYSITDFVILEKGNDLKKRRCIGENNFSCLFCKDGCSTTEGVGGANALHGNKLCYFPASSHITKAFNQSEKDNALNYLNGIAPSYFDVNFNSYIEDSTCRKRYNSDVFNSRHFSEMIYKLTSRINNSIITKSNVSSIKKINNFFEVLTEAGDKYICEKLVLGQEDLPIKV